MNQFHPETDPKIRTAQDRVPPQLTYPKPDLLKLRDLLEEKTGIYFSDDKLDRLEEPFRDSRHLLASTAPAEAIQEIRAGSDRGAAYLNQLVGAVATNETYFFRTRPHFQVLKGYLLPEISQAKNSQGKKSLRIWSAGCSTGEEPYSIAILLLETIPDIRAWDVTILATDIDLEALERAQEGIYRPWSFRGVGPEIIKKYFHPEKGERYRIDERIRSWVTFRPFNLKCDPCPSPLNGTSDLDIIFCRNVTIYFRLETTEKILRNFYTCLREEGFLLAGAAEYFPQAYQDFEVRVFPESLVYQKPSLQKRILRPGPVLSLLPAWQPVQPAASRARKPVPESKKPAPEKRAESHPLDQALDLINRGETDKALVLLAGWAEKSPDDTRVCYLLGKISADRHHFPEAYHWLSRALQLDPLHLWSQYLLGLLWMEEGKTDEALQAFKKTVYIDPSLALGHFYLGRIYKERGQLEKARKSFAAVKSLLDPAPPSEVLRGTEGITTQQLLSLVDREVGHGG